MKNKTLNLYLKANRKASREVEIEAFGHPLPKHKVHKSKKIYNRKKNKAGRNDLPFFCLYNFTHKSIYKKNNQLLVLLRC